MDSDKVAVVTAFTSGRLWFSRPCGLLLQVHPRLRLHRSTTQSSPAQGGVSLDVGSAAAYDALKRALSSAPVLQMLDFTREFVVNCDASGAGVGAVLHQGSGPLAFFSRPFVTRHIKLAAYERDLIGLVQAVRHWRPYLWGRRFLVRTDHYSLKFLLDQRLSTVPQHHWVSKLLRFDFAVEYRPGRLNSVTDALSRRDEDAVTELALSGPSFALYDDIRAATREDPVARGLLQQQAAGTLEAPWTIADWFLLRGKRVYVPDLQDLCHQVVTLAHTTGHEGVHKTLLRLRNDFYIPNDRKLVQDYVCTCDVCQRNKTPMTQPAGLLQPLDVPSQVWTDTSMDFIDALPKVHGKSVILTVVDRFSKNAHFITLSHPYTAASVARAFFERIVRLHGFPTSIVVTAIQFSLATCGGICFALQV